jgi:hypothetical protein
MAAPYAAAQKFEAFGGYSVTRMKTEKDFEPANTHGWNASFTAYPTSRLGFTTDVAGYYSTLGHGSDPAVSLRQYTFMAGPQVRILRKERFETSFHALFGAARGEVPGSADETTFAANFGTNFDVKVSRRVAMRFSPGLYLTQFGTETQRNFRFSVGPVFRFGD